MDVTRTLTKEGTDLETERLELRPLRGADLTDLHRVFDDPAVRRYLFDGGPVSLETTASILLNGVRDFHCMGVGLFGLRPRGKAGLIGFCGLRWEPGLGEMELVFGLLPEHWGRGLATEAAAECLRFAFEEAGLERVFAGTDPPNAGSLRVIEKLGIGPVGEITPDQPGVAFFALDRKDFRPSGG